MILFLILLLAIPTFSAKTRPHILGIDLGSSQLRTSILVRGFPIDLVENIHSKRYSDNSISFTENGPLYGKDSKSMIQRSPNSTFQYLTWVYGLRKFDPETRLEKLNRFQNVFVNFPTSFADSIGDGSDDMVIDFGFKSPLKTIYPQHVPSGDLITLMLHKADSMGKTHVKKLLTGSTEPDYESIETPPTFDPSVISGLNLDPSQIARLQNSLNSKENSHLSAQQLLNLEYDPVVVPPKIPLDSMVDHMIGGSSSKHSKKRTNAVITVPPSFSLKDRQDLVDLAEIAGINVLGLIHDISAASYQYGHERAASSEIFSSNDTFVVFLDIGATSSSVILTKFDSVKVPVAKGFSTTRTANSLKTVKFSTVERGGIDYDSILYDIVLEKLATVFDLDDAKASDLIDDTQLQRIKSRLIIATQKAKETLSANNQVVFHIDSLIPESLAKETQSDTASLSTFGDFLTSLSRKEFLSRTGTIDQEILEMFDILDESDDIQAVVLVGGGGRMPHLQDMVKQKLGRNSLETHLNVEEATSMGASLHAASKSAAFWSPKFEFQDFVPFDVYANIFSSQDDEWVPHHSKKLNTKLASSRDTFSISVPLPKDPYQTRMLVSCLTQGVSVAENAYGAYVGNIASKLDKYNWSSTLNEDEAPVYQLPDDDLSGDMRPILRLVFGFDSKILFPKLVSARLMGYIWEPVECADDSATGTDDSATPTDADSHDTTTDSDNTDDTDDTPTDTDSAQNTIDTEKASCTPTFHQVPKSIALNITPLTKAKIGGKLAKFLPRIPPSLKKQTKSRLKQQLELEIGKDRNDRVFNKIESYIYSSLDILEQIQSVDPVYIESLTDFFSSQVEIFEDDPNLLFESQENDSNSRNFQSLDYLQILKDKMGPIYQHIFESKNLINKINTAVETLDTIYRERVDTLNVPLVLFEQEKQKDTGFLSTLKQGVKELLLSKENKNKKYPFVSSGDVESLLLQINSTIQLFQEMKTSALERFEAPLKESDGYLSVSSSQIQEKVDSLNSFITVYENGPKKKLDDYFSILAEDLEQTVPDVVDSPAVPEESGNSPDDTSDDLPNDSSDDLPYDSSDDSSDDLPNDSSTSPDVPGESNQSDSAEPSSSNNSNKPLNEDPDSENHQNFHDL